MSYKKYMNVGINKENISMQRLIRYFRAVLSGSVVAIFLVGCSTTGSGRLNAEACSAPLNQRLDMAIEEVKGRMDGGCRDQYAGMFEMLLKIGEGDPKLENKRLFSNYLLWASDKGYISPLQAKETYTRYFGNKFVSALSDYSTCAAFCPTKTELLGEMRSELQLKARGLMEISRDRSTFGVASSLYEELELVITATCSACTAR